ncbi:hypothetical protein BDV29DRAFT_162569 [Aspergillus leporis]|uniref:Uncharacterized protein n=1 Tax=Aspergillus leporis TaxID=41062 RepID=A0A5N5WKB0_9EURO|nr:hypothetical protein BDV29DRAFT_162569 [Aspergillus leporis]
MERILETIEYMDCADTDVIASKPSRTIHHLLSVEATAANSTKYSTSSSKGDEGELECDGKLTNSCHPLHVYISHLGAIDFERDPISKSTSAAVSTQPELGTCPHQPRKHCLPTNWSNKTINRYLPRTVRWRVR